MTKKLELQSGRPKNVNFTGSCISGTSSTKTADYTVTDSDNGLLIPFDLSSGSLIVTLNTPTESLFFVTFKDINGNAATNNLSIIMPQGIDKITDNYGCYTYVYSNSVWGRVSNYNGSAPIAARGIFGGGSTTGSYANLISSNNYIDIATTGNATSFGNLTVNRLGPGGCSSTIRGLFGGGDASGASSNVIDYTIFSTLANAVDFGDLTVARSSISALSSTTRGIFAGGAGPASNVIDYITIATTGNAVDFGDLLANRNSLAGAGSTTRGLFFGGNGPSDVIQYITIATTGNSSSFGTLINGVLAPAACSSITRAISFSGQKSGAITVTTSEYVTIASLGNSTLFGNLNAGAYYGAACSSQIRGVFAGGYGPTNTIEYITITSLGNSTSFGNLTGNRVEHGACSNNHGGL